MKWIATNNITFWANQRDCQENLPFLIKRLIRATCNSLQLTSFASGDDVLIGGWDGILETYEQTENLPLGTSLWEFGAQKDVKAKADEDFEKRSVNSLGFDPSTSTFVFVTPRIYTKKSLWIREKKKLGLWKDIQFFDAQDISDWIERAPAVGYWLATKHLGILPSQGIQSADDFWEEWSTGNKINFKPNVVLSGRDQEAQQLLDYANTPSIIPVKAPSREESTAFIVAAFMKAGQRKEEFFSRALIVDSADAFRELMVLKEPLFLIVRFDDNGIINRAKDKRHIVFIPLGFENSGQWSSIIELPPLGRETFVQALIDSGMRNEAAEAMSKRSARNLIVIRRLLEFQRLVPEWAKKENVRDILPALLAGRWDEDRPGDKETIAALADEEYNTYIERLNAWRYVADAPIVKIGNTWRLTSPLDAWTHAGKYCTRLHYEKLRATIVATFAIVDPKFELASVDRFKQSWFGIKRTFSAWIREGQLQSLILIAFYGDDIALDLSDQPQRWVDHIIKDVLNTEDSDLWKSFDHEMSLIAEASPTAFLYRIEELLKIPNNPLIKLFEEDPGFLSGHPYHTGLLWALESLAWLPEYLSRSALVLAQLDENDPGGNIINRPGNSLKEIFKSWYPQTFANVPSRFDTLKLLLKMYPKVGYKVLSSLLPNNRGVAHPTHRMRWRLSDLSIPEGISYDDLYHTYDNAVDLIVEVFDNSEHQFICLLEGAQNLNPANREKIFSLFEKNLETLKQADINVWHELRKVLSRHKTSPDTDWALPKQDIERLERLYVQLQPEDNVDKILWLFTEQWPQLLIRRTRNEGFENYGQRLQEVRINALKSVYENGGLNSIFELISFPDIKVNVLGVTTADILKKQSELDQIYPFLAREEPFLSFIQFVIAQEYRKSPESVFRRYNELVKLNYHAEDLSKIFLRLPGNKLLWDFIEQTDLIVKDGYWQFVDASTFYATIEDRIFAINQFIKYGRLTSAVYLASQSAEGLETDLLISILELFISSKPENDMKIDSHDIESIFEILEKREIGDSNVMIKLEWLYLPILGHNYNHLKTPRLYRELADNPDFFIQVLELVYKPDNLDKEAIPTDPVEIEKIVEMATLGMALLKDWRLIPGVGDDGEIDEKKMLSWFNSVRGKAKVINRQQPAAYKIGYILSQYPEKNIAMNPQEEINWPPDIICQILEDVGGHEVFDSFSAGTANKRSFSSRGPYDGGKREWHLAKYFKTLAKVKAARFPNVARVFSDLAVRYEAEAIREDERAQKDGLDY